MNEEEIAFVTETFDEDSDHGDEVEYTGGKGDTDEENSDGDVGGVIMEDMEEQEKKLAN